MSIDLRERLEMTRHVRGCALLTVAGEVVGALGAEAEDVEAAGVGLLAFLRSTGAIGEPSLAAIVELADGALFLRSFQGDLLVVKTDGAFDMSDGCFEALIEALTPRVLNATEQSGIRQSGIVPRSSTKLERVG